MCIVIFEGNILFGYVKSVKRTAQYIGDDLKVDILELSKRVHRQIAFQNNLSYTIINGE